MLNVHVFQDDILSFVVIVVDGVIALGRVLRVLGE